MITELRQIMDGKGMSDLDIALAVSGISGQRTTVLEELTENEMLSLLSIYKPIKSQENARKRLQQLEEERLIKMKRSIILKDAQTAHIHNPEDWSKFNQWMLKSSVLHKPLKDYTLEELDLLKVQMKKIVQKFKKNSKRTGTKAWYQFHGFPVPGRN